MTFFPADHEVPSGLDTDEFVLRPLTVDHVELDYATLMVSVEMLRRWGGTGWPADDFTLDDNLADLEYHEREHREGVAFTYTMLSPDQTECLGCVYVRPLGDLVAAGTDLPADIPVDGASVRFWAAAPRLADDLDRRLLDTLRTWFHSQWPYASVWFCAREDDERQVDLMVESGLTRRSSVAVRGRSGRFILFESDERALAVG